MTLSQEILQYLKKDLKTRFKIELIGVFGSYARGDQHADSDIDLIYRNDDDVQLGIFEMMDIEDYIARQLGIPRVDLVHVDYINPVVELSIKNELLYV